MPIYLLWGENQTQKIRTGIKNSGRDYLCYLLIHNERLILTAKISGNSRTKPPGICGLRGGRGIRTGPGALALQQQQQEERKEEAEEGGFPPQTTNSGPPSGCPGLVIHPPKSEVRSARRSQGVREVHLCRR